MTRTRTKGQTPKTVAALNGFIFVLLAALILIAGQRANAAESQAINLKSGALSLHGTSTLHAFTATTQTFEIRSSVAPATAPGWETVLQPKVVTSFEVHIPVLSLKSEKDGLNKNMYKLLKAQQHSHIVFRMKDYVVGATAGDVVLLTVKGTLSVGGVERETELALETKVTPEGLSVSGAKELLMTDFGIKPPSFMFGAMKTDNKLVIRFSLVFARSQS